MLFDKWGVVVEVTNKRSPTKCLYFLVIPKIQIRTLKPFFFFSIDKAMDALFAQSLFSKNAPKLKQRYKIYWIGLVHYLLSNVATISIQPFYTVSRLPTSPILTS